MQSKRQAVAAAQAVVKGQKELEAYLHITAPFDGVVTERLVHPGALGSGFSATGLCGKHCPGGAHDMKTRTMAVELDVFNRDGSFSPGMYLSVKWPVRRGAASLLVPERAW